MLLARSVARSFAHWNQKMCTNGTHRANWKRRRRKKNRRTATKHTYIHFVFAFFSLHVSFFFVSNICCLNWFLWLSLFHQFGYLLKMPNHIQLIYVTFLAIASIFFPLFCVYDQLSSRIPKLTKQHKSKENQIMIIGLHRIGHHFLTAKCSMTLKLMTLLNRN